MIVLRHKEPEALNIFLYLFIICFLNIYIDLFLNFVSQLPEQVPKEPELQVDHQCNKGEAEIDLQQIQDGVVLKLQERLSFCWQCCKIQQVVPLRIETSYKSLPQVQGQDNGAEVYIQ